MARPRSSESYSSEANIWPAVTDSILLMASIFIVLSVVSLLSIARRVDDQAGAGEEGGDRTICEVVSLSEKFLFDTGRSEFRSPDDARGELKKKLYYLQPRLENLHRYARSQKDWNENYYLVLEVSGHTDYLPMARSKKTEDGNWNLAAERAVTVAHELEDILRHSPELAKSFKIQLKKGTREAPDQGTAPAKSMVLRVAGYSSHLPAVNYKQPKAMEWNRRVELRLYAQPVYILRTEVKL